MTDAEKKKLLDCFVRTGAALLSCGAEIYRVEESVRLLAGAYGASDVSVFAIPSFIAVTLRFAPEEDALTDTRRIAQTTTDMSAVSDINALCRRAVAGNLSVESFSSQLEARLSRSALNRRFLPLVYPLIAGAFCVFFGGSLIDAAAALVCGLVIWLITDFFSRYGANAFFSCVAAAAACSTTALLFSLTGWTTGPEPIIIGSLMLLVPGVALTNFMRNLIAGDVLSGLIKLAESLLVAVAVALGAGIPVTLFRLLGVGV
ncbi:MAG: threonine/serine exporter family protein [Eubacteriales bacterium]|nr:threonine/serine exporter family protein [Eubacteriales bacterium]